MDDDVEGFLALLAARRAPRTVEAYRRDLSMVRAYLGKPVAEASLEELERYTAQLRADGLATATIARRTAAARSFFRHQQLLGARTDNPAAAVALPRRTRRLPRTLSPGEAERLIDAASGVGPRDFRDGGSQRAGALGKEQNAYRNSERRHGDSVRVRVQSSKNLPRISRIARILF